jgi:hypothetical protein
VRSRGGRCGIIAFVVVRDPRAHPLSRRCVKALPTASAGSFSDVAGDVIGRPRTPLGRVRGHAAPLLVVVAYALLQTAWIFGNPTFAAPDEWAHYLRAVSIGHGHLTGEPASAESIVGSSPPPGMSRATYEAALRFTDETSRRITVPDGLMPSWQQCPQTDPLVSARCLNDVAPIRGPTTVVIPTGGYQPLPYLLLAPLTRLHESPDTLDHLMRLVKATLVLSLLAVAIAMLWKPGVGVLPLTGPVVAITPMVVFLGSSLNPSGIEIAAAIAFTAALLRLARDEGPVRSPWLVVGVCGAVLALSRGPSPFWILCNGTVAVLLLGPSSAWRLLARDRRWSVPALGALAFAVIGNRVWEGLYGPALTVDPTPLDAALTEGWRQLPQLLLEQVGVFNYLEFGMPPLAYTLWDALAVALVTIALVVGTRRERLVVAGTSVAALALPVLLVAAVMRHTGYSLQGRYVLPFSVVMPLLAGEVLVRRSDRLRALRAEGVFLAFAIAAAAVQLTAWWANAHRFAVGRSGPRWFLDKAEWSPSSGWWLWFILAVVGAALLVAVDPIARFYSSASRRASAGELDSATATARVAR